MSAGTLKRMQEFLSLKVSANDHADLATQLTTMSTQGWNVVNIVSTGTDLIAYLARSAGQSTNATSASSSNSPVTSADSAVGWASTGSLTSAVTGASTSPTVPADWYKDPSGRFEYRYWDGSKWTENVSRAGVAYKDPPIP
jgi:hypothetical protein